MFDAIQSFIFVVPFLLIGLSVFRFKSIRLQLALAQTLVGIGMLSALTILTLRVVSGTQDISFYPNELLLIDPLSVTVYTMIAIIGFVVLRFTRNYLEGDNRQLLFIQRLTFTIASVMMLVLSGNLYVFFTAWVATSIGLQFLIGFYRDREEARSAVRKKFVVARLSDICLLIGFGLLHLTFKTTSLPNILQALQDVQQQSIPFTLELSALFIAFSAILKSVQLPFHGWVLDVMEAPTPLSALLHAGLLNAGPFLIIRFAFLFDVTFIGSFTLLIIGGLSALLGTFVFPVQSSIKRSLAFSSVGHMGFSLMICGMGLYSAALLHVIAHSFYKAHAFLSSGSAVDKHRLSQLNGEQMNHISLLQFLIGTGLSTLLFFLLSNYWLAEIVQLNTPMLLLGAIIVIGVSNILVRTAAKENNISIVLKSIALTGLVLLSFFILEKGTHALMANTIPNFSESDSAIIAASFVLVTMFFGINAIALIPLEHRVKLNVYRKNGFYIHVFVDQLIKRRYSKLLK